MEYDQNKTIGTRPKKFIRSRFLSNLGASLSFPYDLNTSGGQRISAVEMKVFLLNESIKKSLLCVYTIKFNLKVLFSHRIVNKKQLLIMLPIYLNNKDVSKEKGQAILNI
jgi:hypothetical protein